MRASELVRVSNWREAHVADVGRNKIFINRLCHWTEALRALVVPRVEILVSFM